MLEILIKKTVNSIWFQILILSSLLGFTVLRSYRQFQITVRKIPRNTEESKLPPSYLRICSEIFSGSKSIIQDESIVCNSMDFHSSLMKIYASSFLVSQLKDSSNSNIHYEHGCSSFSKHNNDAIQNYLDPNIVFPVITQGLAQDLCVRCRTAECILFSDLTYKDAVLNTIDNSLDKALKNYALAKGRVVQALDVASHSASIVLTGEKCYENIEHFHIYPQEIPRSIDSIYVLYSESFRAACEVQCSHDLTHSLSHSNCFYGFRLMKFLKNFFSKRVLTYQQASSIEMFYKIKRSSYFICPTHDQCLFPALTANHHASLIGKDGDSSINTWLKDQNNTIVVDSKFRDGTCRYISGKKGRWTYDLESAKAFQYTLDLKHYFGTAQLEYNATKERPYRQSTTYKWNEQNFPKCRLSYLSYDGICNVLWSLKIQRIMFVGDSLQFNMAQAFWKTIGQNDTIIDNYKGKFACSITTPVKKKLSYIVELIFIRNDQLIENDLPVNPVKQIKNCNAYCLPWTDVYNSTSKNTLLILNTGSHLGQLKTFKDTMDNVLQKIDNFKRNNDIIFLRTTAPGHEDCLKYDSPFPNHEAYLATNPTKEHFYKWDKFSLYNDHLATIVDKRRRERLQHLTLHDSSPQTELLDIFYMTVLRPDGHISGPECSNERCKTKIDCLHYNLPGPLDWWNHLLFSHLQNVMEEKKLERILTKPVDPLSYLNTRL